MSYRRAKSLDRLLEQINAKYPGRDKSSDGWIGDSAHASRVSDHNPWVRDGGVGVVTAQDIDEDLNLTGKSLMQVVDAICASRDRRVKYIIYEGRITKKGTDLQAWKPYTGRNAHRHHAHISVFPEKTLYDDTSDWAIEPVPTAPSPVIGADVYYYVVRGDTLWGIARRFATSVDSLKEFNNLTSDVIAVGQVLKIN